MSASETEALISALEALSARVQSAVEKEPEKIDEELSAAMSAASNVIAMAIPKDEQEKWLGELETFQSSRPSDEDEIITSLEDSPSSSKYGPVSCTCDLLQANSDSGVACIHGCQRRFCSGACRKRQARAHRAQCDALMRKALLKKIGLSSEQELF